MRNQIERQLDRIFAPWAPEAHPPWVATDHDLAQVDDEQAGPLLRSWPTPGRSILMGGGSGLIASVHEDGRLLDALLALPSFEEWQAGHTTGDADEDWARYYGDTVWPAIDETAGQIFGR